MVLERAEIIVKDGLMDECLAALRERGLPLTRQFTGCHSFRAYKGVEDANSVMLLAEWESIEAHIESRSEPAHVEFRAVVLPFAAGAKPTVHFELV